MPYATTFYLPFDQYTTDATYETFFADNVFSLSSERITQEDRLLEDSIGYHSGNERLVFYPRDGEIEYYNDLRLLDVEINNRSINMKLGTNDLEEWRKIESKAASF